MKKSTLRSTTCFVFVAFALLACSGKPVSPNPESGSSSVTAGSSTVTAGSSSATAGSSSATAGSSSASAGSSKVTAGQTSGSVPTARIAGDYPDPSVIRVNDTYYAVATTSAWAPAFTLLTSKDLTNWETTSAVFTKVPDWSDGNYWAPEIVQMDKIFFVYYTAKNKKNQRLCVAVATAKSPLGPYRDHGPLICEDVGSIDGAAVIDEKGDKYLFWKTDGNSQQKPTPIHVQKLSKDGTKLVGKSVDTITNDSEWEKKLVEGPYVLKRNGMWYMFYAGSDCCGRECKYAVGVARSKSLQGPWEKNPANPILKSSDAWKCPGHGSVVTDSAGRDIFVYHAYNAKDFTDVGRQAMADGIDWNESTGWPSINNGLGAGLNLNGSLPAVAKKEVAPIDEDFATKTLSPVWQWPHNQIPKFTLDAKKTQLQLHAKKNAPLAAFIARMANHGTYIATTEIDRISSKNTLAGIAAVGNPANAFSLAVKNNALELWQIKDSKQTVLATVEKLEGSAKQPLLLRMSARDGHFFRFAYSSDGKVWNDVGPELDGSFLPPWDLGIRIALTAGNGTAFFNKFTLEAKVQ